MGILVLVTLPLLVWLYSLLADYTYGGGAGAGPRSIAFLLAALWVGFFLWHRWRIWEAKERYERHISQIEQAARAEAQRREQAARAEAQRREQEAFAEAQRALAIQLQELITKAGRNVHILPMFLTIAKKLLDQAEFEFGDGAFAPFWAAVEGASDQLASYHHTVQAIERDSQQYQSLLPELKSPPPRFDVATRFPDPSTIVAQISAIVRKAQKDFQFSTIYEQRKTNQILSSGFAQLATELSGLGDRFVRSVDDLGGRVVGALRDASEEQMEAMSELDERIAEAAETAHDDASDASEMLDNIQRHRKPDPFD